MYNPRCPRLASPSLCQEAAPRGHAMPSSGSKLGGVPYSGHRVLRARGHGFVALVAGAAASALISGCSISVDYTGTLFACGEDGACPDGQVCEEQVCVPTSRSSSCAAYVDTGAGHTCAVRTDGTVWCWGANDGGQLGDGTTTDQVIPVQAVGVAGAVAIATGRLHTCALLGSGEVQCWGNNSNGRLGDDRTVDSAVPVSVKNLADVVQIDAGAAHTCARTSAGAVFCWGANDVGQCGDGSSADHRIPAVVPNLVATSLSISFDSSCAITSTGASCWGANRGGQFGLGNESVQTRPVALPLTGPVLAIGMGSTHGCASTASGLACVGQNADGQLGIGTSLPSLAFRPVLLPAKALEIHAGSRHTCVRDEAKRAWCWGHNQENKLGYGGPGLWSPALAQLDHVEQLSVGTDYTCALESSGAVRCTGFNGWGGLGNGLRTTQKAPRLVAGLANVSQIAASGGATCAVQDDQTSCWGESNDGESGTGSLSDVYTPQLILGAATSIAGGANHFCALVGGGVQCWGANYDGTLGDGSLSTRPVPAPTAPLGGTASSLAAGDGHACALVGNVVKCWGSNTNGQLGTNDKTPRAVPTTATVITGGATAIAAGRRHTCAIIAGAVQCWGANDRGQLGNTAALESLTPVVVSIPAGAVEIRLRGDHSFARLASGQLYAWGDGCGGRLGKFGFGCGPHPPTLILDAVAKVTAGYGAVCALKTDGSVWCWGGGEYGQNGSGVYEQREAPAMVVGLAGVKDIATGAAHTCVVNADATVSCFGYDGMGQLGDGRQVVDAPSIARMVCD